VPDAPLGERISALLRDARGRLWIGTWQGLFRIEEGEVRDPLEPRNRVSTDPVESLFERDDGTVIAVSMHALTALRDGAPPVRTPAAELGALFEDVELRCAAEDTAGNLWIGTAGGGAIRLDRRSSPVGMAPPARSSFPGIASSSPATTGPGSGRSSPSRFAIGW
jgi:ligand-binding sensor domain-containing protein